jgi:CheY-like chemotaxis protein
MTVVRISIRRERDTEMLLTQLHYRVFTAEDGGEAQELLEKTEVPISAIVLDWAMPKVTGIEVLRWIKAQERLQDIPVVMQTGMASTENIKEGIEAGAYYYLTKPVSPDVLESVISVAVNDYHDRTELLQKLKEGENPFKNLSHGVFKFRTMEEGEYLAVKIANLSSSPQCLLALSEIITNAVEHGNLGISYQEKSELMANGTWLQEVRRRLELPENKDKFVTLTLTVDGPKILVEVEDRGSGFDFQRYLKMDEERVFDNHGRGIALTSQYVDLEFIGPGNMARLILPH